MSELLLTKWSIESVFNRKIGAVVIVWYLALQLSMQSVPVTSNVVSSNPAHDQVYSIQHYVFVSDFRQVGGFPRVLRFRTVCSLQWPNLSLPEFTGLVSF
jgi:hypothetical protein